VLKNLQRILFLFILTSLLSSCDDKGQTCAFQDSECVLKNIYNYDYENDDIENSAELIACGPNGKQICATLYAEEDKWYEFNGKMYLVVSNQAFRDVLENTKMSDAIKGDYYKSIVTTFVTDMNYAFGWDNYPPTTIDNRQVDVIVTHWDTSSVTNMSYMFYNNSNHFADNMIEDWNISSVTTMAHMFGYTTGNHNPKITGWDVSSVTDMDLMFATCAACNQDLSGWQVSQVTNFYSFCAKSGMDKDTTASGSTKSPFIKNGKPSCAPQ
jgi:surface protein